MRKSSLQWNTIYRYRKTEATYLSLSELVSPRFGRLKSQQTLINVLLLLLLLLNVELGD